MGNRVRTVLLAFLAAGLLKADVLVLGDALVFTNLTADTAYALPEAGATYARIASYANHSVTVNGGPLTLTGGSASYAPAIENRSPTNYSAFLTFNVPVSLANPDATGGVGLLYLGGCTFNRPVTLESSTKPLAIRRVRAATVKFYAGTGAPTTNDFSRAESVTLGIEGRDSSGVTLIAYTNVTLKLPDVTVAKVSSLQANGENAVVTAGDVSFVDPAYFANGKFSYSTLALNNKSALRCRRLVQRPGSGAQFSFGTGVRTDAQAIELNSSASPAATIWSCTFHTPDFNLRGSAPALVCGALAFDVTAITTRVARLSFDPTKSASVVVSGGGAIEFVGETTLPRLVLNKGTTLLFDAVVEDRPPLAISSFTLPTSGRAKLCVRNRMLSGKVALATGITAAQLANMDVEIAASARLYVADGVLTYEIDGVDLAQPARATWVGAGDRSRMDDPANWACLDANGQPMAGQLPTVATDVRISGLTSFNFPPGAAFSGGTLALGGKIVLSADCDWRGVAADALAEGVTIDLNGHRLLLARGSEDEDRRMTITDSTADAAQPGEVVVEVAPKGFALARKTVFSGNLRLVKAGGGTLVVSRAGCSFAGGEEVEGGRTIHVGEALAYEELGAVGDGVTDDWPAIVATHDCANRLDVPVRARDGATYYIGGRNLTATVHTDVDFGTARFIVDDTDVEDYLANLFDVLSRQDPIAVVGATSLAVGQRNLGVTLPCRSVVYVRDAEIKRFIRSGDNANAGSDQQEVLLVDAEGNIDGRTPVTWNYPKFTEVTAFPIDARTLTIRGGEFTTIANRSGARVYYNRGFNVNRSNVRIEGLKHYVVEPGDPPGSVLSSPYSGFVSALKCANVTVSNCVFTGRKNYSIMGSYDLRGNNAVNLRFEHCTQANDINDSAFWGILGSNFCRLLAYDHCTLSRFDAHQGMYHAAITDSTIGINGVNAIGYGVLRIENTTVNANHFVNLRNDYGSFWRGEIVVRNCRFVPKAGQSTTGLLLNGLNDGTHDYGYDCMMPWRVTVDGLEIDDSKHPSSYKGPYLFANFNPEKTSSSYHEAYPYFVTEKVVLHNVTTKSGKPFQRSSNAYMFRDVQIVDDMPTDIGFALDPPVAGWNWTNVMVSAEVTRIDPAVTNGQLRMEVRDALGHVVEEITKPVTGPGRVDFEVELPAGGAYYDYSVSALDGDRALFFADSETASGVFAGCLTATPGDNFSAAVEEGREILSNGVWQVAPRVDAAQGRFAVEGQTSFRLARPTESRLVQVDMKYVVEGFLLDSDAKVLDAIGFTAMRDTSGGQENRGRWMTIRADADGRRWVPLYGAEPEIGREYVVRIEYDRGIAPPRVRFSVKAEDEDEPTVLADAGGVVWLPSSLADARAIAGVDFLGHGALTRFHGTAGDAVVAETGGRGYGDLNEAIAAAARNQMPVTLLVDVAFVPSGSSGEVLIEVNGNRLRWQDGVDSALAHDPQTGRFKLIALTDGRCPNGLNSYSSYALGLNAADAASRPLLFFVRQSDGSVALTLNVDPPAEFEGRISYRLEESDDVRFTNPQFRESAVPVFKIDYGAGERRFYRAHILLQ